jgi:hypothetical protein
VKGAVPVELNEALPSATLRRARGQLYVEELLDPCARAHLIRAEAKQKGRRDLEMFVMAIMGKMKMVIIEA